jgi:glyoxylase-like metal-dependent hydrolase (beta-lactamase superfamily II)
MFEEAVRFPNANSRTVMTLAGDYLATNQFAAGQEYFEERARETGRPLFGALVGLFQARRAGEIPLLRRIAWVEEAVGRLDRAVAAGDGLSRYLRGLVTAELPARFHRAETAVADLEWVLSRPNDFPRGVRRNATAALAKAQSILGRPSTAQGGSSFITDYMVNAADGFRFSPKEIVEPEAGVFVARGYDFADLMFVVTSDGSLVAIDAGTTAANVREALGELRHHTQAPLRAILVTHAHWDHIGGIEALAGPDIQIVAAAGWATELARVNLARNPFRYFWGTSENASYSFKPTRVVEHDETLTIGGTRFELVPVHGGETDDALVVHVPERKVTFVGDVFMPYFGAPFAAEGSVDGLVAAVDKIRALGAARLLHGHAPLTENFGWDVIAPLAAALAETQKATLAAMHDAHTLPEILRAAHVPSLLAKHPAAVLPYILMQDNAIKRTYAQNTGYWKADGEGMEIVAPDELGRAVDLLAGGDAGAFVRAAGSLSERGDFALARQIAELGLRAHPNTAELVAARRRALGGLRQKHQVNAFKFLIYSELLGAELR